jgi:hypothetical protein
MAPPMNNAPPIEPYVAIDTMVVAAKSPCCPGGTTFSTLVHSR